ncbi:MAG: small subunit ribosomal protein [Planctomycetota bacterium]|nr:MAG: small subunit ribosomal protein [Planctomycetota bacterium]
MSTPTTTTPPAPVQAPLSDKMVWWGTGRRKTAIARVRLKKGTGRVVVNGLEYEKYFDAVQDRLMVLSPLQTAKAVNRFDVFSNCCGGGKTGQAGAMVLGISRALLKADATAEIPLRDAGFLTRDGRMKERKKYGRRGARRGFQFSKR